MQRTVHSYKEGSIFRSVRDIKNKHITIMGLGLNGGGEVATRFFLKHGAFVTVTDTKDENALGPTLDSLNNDKSLDKSRLQYHLGAHRIEDFSNADCVIKNPGVKYEGNEFLAVAKNIETDISVFLSFSKSPIIAITGSKGKSSTVSALHYGLSTTGITTFLGGNITLSPLSFLEKTNETTPVILELSSWQLADLRGRKILKPQISLITKIVSDHQNWYGSMDSYIADKRLIYENQQSDSYTIFDNDLDSDGTPSPNNFRSWGDFFASESRAKVLRYGTSPLQKDKFGVWQEKNSKGLVSGKIFLPGMNEPQIILENILVPGKHMYSNVLNAALIMSLLKIRKERITQILSTWKGIPHRLQFFYTANDGTKFYNDSCATVPEAAASASQAFGKQVVLIAGGTDKNLKHESFIETLKQKDAIPLQALYLLEGSATESLVPLLKDANINFYGPYDSLENLLVELKKNEKEKEQIVVFSPGSTSFGMFKNEFDRGNTFMSEVQKLF